MYALSRIESHTWEIKLEFGQDFNTIVRGTVTCVGDDEAATIDVSNTPRQHPLLDDVNLLFYDFAGQQEYYCMYDDFDTMLDILHVLHPTPPRIWHTTHDVLGLATVVLDASDLRYSISA